MTSRSLRLASASAMLAACVACSDGGPEPVPVDPAEHERAVAAFATARNAELAAPDSWLSLTGLHWLGLGGTTVGSAPDNGIVLADKAAPRVGTVLVDSAGVRWRTEPGVVVTLGVDSTLAAEAGTGAIPFDVSQDPAVEEADLSADVGSGKSVVLRHGDLSWIAIRRGDRWALRTRDNGHPAYQAFRGIERFPTSRDWRITARWVPHEKTVSVPNAMGTVSEEASPAALEFRVGGRPMALDVVGAPTNGRYMLVFADATSGAETYGGGRFLWVDAPDERGRVVLDFNYAFNPPCVWTPYATCPLPTRDNRLPVRVEAGERSPRSAAAVTFRGTIPCADCPGIDLTVTLFPDGTFRLRQRYLDRDPGSTWRDLGRWTEEEGGRLALRGSGERPTWFARYAWDSLRVLDGEGREIPSRLPYGLARAGYVDLVEDVQPLRGMVTWAAGTALFAECLTGTAFPVSESGAYAELEDAYREASTGNAEALLVRVQGRLVGSGTGGEPGAATLVVEAVEGTFPGAGCGEAVADLPLEGTEWRLVELTGEPLPRGTDATLLLEGAGRQASGSAGCNSFVAPYRLDGARLTFGGPALTRRTCAAPVMDAEGTFLRTLVRVGGYRLLGAELQLLAEEGVVARFHSR